MHKHSPYQAAINFEVVGALEESEHFLDNVDAKLIKYFEEARAIRYKKQADYGPSWRSLGLRGVFGMMFAKVCRLRQLVWLRKDAQVKDESVRDTLLDNLNYTLYMLYLLEEGNLDGLEP